MTRVGKPILGEKEYLEVWQAFKQRAEEGNWCSYISDSGSYRCLRSVVGGAFSEPCTKDDFRVCPLKIKGHGIPEGGIEGVD